MSCMLGSSAPLTCLSGSTSAVDVHNMIFSRFSGRTAFWRLRDRKTMLSMTLLTWTWLLLCPQLLLICPHWLLLVVLEDKVVAPKIACLHKLCSWCWLQVAGVILWLYCPVEHARGVHRDSRLRARPPLI